MASNRRMHYCAECGAFRPLWHRHVAPSLFDLLGWLGVED